MGTPAQRWRDAEHASSLRAEGSAPLLFEAAPVGRNASVNDPAVLPVAGATEPEIAEWKALRKEIADYYPGCTVARQRNPGDEPAAVLMLGKLAQGKSALCDTLERIFNPTIRAGDPAAAAPLDVALTQSWTQQVTYIRLTENVNVVDTPGFLNYVLRDVVSHVELLLYQADAMIFVFSAEDWNQRKLTSQFMVPTLQKLRAELGRSPDLVVTHGAKLSEERQNELKAWATPLGFGQVYLIECYTDTSTPRKIATEILAMRALRRALIFGDRTRHNRQQHARRAAERNANRPPPRSNSSVGKSVGMGAGAGLATGAAIGGAAGMILGPPGAAVGLLLGGAIGGFIGLVTGGVAGVVAAQSASPPP